MDKRDTKTKPPAKLSERCPRDTGWCDGAVCRENGIECPFQDSQHETERLDELRVWCEDNADGIEEGWAAEFEDEVPPLRADLAGQVEAYRACAREIARSSTSFDATGQREES